MAYQTGSANGVCDLLSQLSTFLQANGWSLTQQLSLNDMVFKSTGSTGKKNLVVRLTDEAKILNYTSQTVAFPVGAVVTGGTSGATAVVVANSSAGASGFISICSVVGTFVNGETLTGSPSGSATASGTITGQTWKALNMGWNQFEHLSARGYSFWNTGTKTGVNEFGRIGPWYVVGPDSGAIKWDVARPNNWALGPVNLDDQLANGVGSTIATSSAEQPFQTWDRKRKFLQVARGSTQIMSFYDLATQTGWQSAVNCPGQYPMNAIWVWDRSGGKEYYYVLTSSATTSQQWFRYDIVADSWTSLASPSTALGGSTPANGDALAYDGQDAIYYRHEGTTTLVKYSIANNSWTTLAVAGQSKTDSAFIQGIYVPAACIPAQTEDVIYFLHDATANLYRYNVTSNTWATNTSNGIIALPASAVSSFSQVIFDGNRYFYLIISSSDFNTYRLDLQNISNGWTALGEQYTRSLVSNPQPHYIDTPVAYLHGTATSSMNFWFIGDADSVKVVTNFNGNYFWMYFGLFDGLFGSTETSTTGPVSPGTAVSIPVSTSVAFAPGDKKWICDPATGTIERISIVSVPDNAHITASLKNSYGSGSLVGDTPAQACVTGDSGMAIALTDNYGIQTDSHAAIYRIKPVYPYSRLAKQAPLVRGVIQAVPVVLDGFDVASFASTYENRGQLHGVYAFKLGNGVNGLPNAEDVVTVGTAQYKVFPCESTTHAVEDVAYGLGPIN